MGGSCGQEPEGHDHRHCSPLFASVVALDIARRHEHGRRCVPPKPRANAILRATATPAPAFDGRSRLVAAIDPVHAGEPPRPQRGDPAKQPVSVTCRRSTPKPKVHSGESAYVLSRYTPAQWYGRTHRLPFPCHEESRATKPVGRLSHLDRKYLHGVRESSGSSGRPEPTPGHALVSSSRRPPLDSSAV